MRSGLDWRDSGVYIEMTRSSDWVQFVLDRPMVAPPGMRWGWDATHPARHGKVRLLVSPRRLVRWSANYLS